MCKDEKVVWHIISFGQTEGNHGVTFNGNNVLIDGVYRDSHVIISGVGLSGVMKPSNVGLLSFYYRYHHAVGRNKTTRGHYDY